MGIGIGIGIILVIFAALALRCHGSKRNHEYIEQQHAANASWPGALQDDQIDQYDNLQREIEQAALDEMVCQQDQNSDGSPSAS